MKRIIFFMPLLLLAACEDRSIPPGSESESVERPATLASYQDIAYGEAMVASMDAQEAAASADEFRGQ